MPFRIDKTTEGFKLYNLHKKEYAKSTFKSKQSAVNQGKNWMRYRKEKGKLVGNKIININK